MVDSRFVPGTTQYQVNTDRDNEFFEFDPARLDLEIEDKDDLISATNYYRSSDTDLFPKYAATDSGAPFVYFDARTYAFGGAVFKIELHTTNEWLRELRIR